MNRPLLPNAISPPNGVGQALKLIERQTDLLGEIDVHTEVDESELPCCCPSKGENPELGSGYSWKLRVYRTDAANEAVPIGFLRAVRRQDGPFSVRGAELLDPAHNIWTKFSGAGMWSRTLVERFQQSVLNSK